MKPTVKIVVGLVATGLVASAAHTLTRAPLLSDLGSRSAHIMAENGVADGRTNWVSDAGWTYRTARISGTADAATRVRTLAAVAALAGVHRAVWVEDAALQPLAAAKPIDCRRQVAAILAARPVRFAPGTSALAPGSDTVVDALALALRICPAARIEVIGQTAPTANSVFSLALSQARASAVVDALTRRGIDGRSLEAIGHGTKPGDPRDNIEVRFATSGPGLARTAS